MSEPISLAKVTSENLIVLDYDAADKKECVNVLAERLYEAGNLRSLEEFLRAVEERESLASTYCTMEIAIPHGISPTVISPMIAFMRLKKTIDWDGDGDSPVRYLFLISMPGQAVQGEENEHVKLLSRIAVMSLDEEFQKKWKNAQSPAQFMELLENYEETPL